MINLDVKVLKEEKGSHEHYDFIETLPDYKKGDYALSFAGPAGISVDLFNSGEGILLNGTVKVGVKMDCARCLAHFDYALDIGLEETYFDEEKGLPYALDIEECIPFKGDEIDIQPEIYKAILLGLPVKALCRPECKGLCPVCGCDLNEHTCNCEQETIDPRLAELKKLLE